MMEVEHANEASLSLIAKPSPKHLSAGLAVIKAHGQPAIRVYIATKAVNVFLHMHMCVKSCVPNW